MEENHTLKNHIHGGEIHTEEENMEGRYVRREVHIAHSGRYKTHKPEGIYIQRGRTYPWRGRTEYTTYITTEGTSHEGDVHI